MTKDDNWKELFRNHRHLLLALKLRADKPAQVIRCLGDEQVVLMGSAAGGARQSKRKATEHVQDVRKSKKPSAIGSCN